ncbi:MAG: hypothetical protein HKN00_09530 [Flavobacteriaceae bacterium]|nr:hypothetical protein [Bacteroidia bacterium]MBT8287775.1 hypothetical protein [Bacteroidia bacterium]NNF75413.1 hypothetical protein [Flavobacteriaceae bacterium]NNK72247.1 hypothetical protein [Flavobacteriaceae bacterium]
MRTNNGKVKNTIISIYFILIVLAVIVTALYSSFSEESQNPAITILIILGIFIVLLIITHNVSKYFEYDSDGIQVVIINKGLLVSEYVNYREHRVEFEKDDLLGYRFRDFIFYKSMVITLRDKQGKKHKERFNVTLVGRRKRKYIRQSLSKIIKENRKTVKKA